MNDDSLVGALGAGDRRSVRVDRDAPGTMWLLVAMVAIFGLGGLGVTARLGWGAPMSDATLHEFARTGFFAWCGLLVLAIASCSPWLARTKISAGPLQVDVEGRGADHDA